MAARGKVHLKTLKENIVRFRRSLCLLTLILLFVGGTTYYITESGRQRAARIQSLLDAGLSLEEAIRFDERFSDQGLRWPWQKNGIYQGNEIKLAEMWINNSVITEFLLYYYYCASSDYRVLVWLLGSLKRGVSFWTEAIDFVVNGDVNHDGISNYDSLLGPYAGILDPLMPNPTVIYAVERGLPRNLIKRLKPFDMDGQMSEWEKEIVDLVAEGVISEDYLEWVVENIEPNPATIYAIKQGLPRTLISKINPLGNDGNLSEWEKYIIDHYTELPPIYIDWIVEKAVKRKILTKWEEYIVNNVDRLPARFIEEILKDKQVSYEEFMQSRFLGRFDKEYLEENGEWINDPDLDDDGFTNEFEVNFLFMDPYTHNGRFAILTCSEGLPPSWKEQVESIEEFLRLNGFKEENIYKLYNGDMTFQNFEQIINIVATKSNEDDLILLLLAGHGRKNEIYFSEGWVSYESIRGVLMRLKTRTQILIIDACYSGTAIPFLKSENRVVIASSREDEETYRGTLFYIFSAMTDESCDLNNDKYCSLLEAFYGAKTMIESRFENHPQISNEALAEKIYVVEFYLRKYM